MKAKVKFTGEIVDVFKKYNYYRERFVYITSYASSVHGVQYDEKDLEILD